GHSLQELISQPLPGGLTAPVGFLVLERLIISAFGNSDYVFRLLPLIAGCAAVILMYFLCRRLLGHLGTTFALGVFAVNWMLLLYSSDLKQYSTDVFFVVLLLLLLAVYLNDETVSKAVALGLGGVVAVAFSHPAIFVLAAVAAVLLIHHHRSRRELWLSVALALAWMTAFALLYFSYYRVVGQERSVVDYWNNLDGLMPVPPWEDPAWFVIRIGSFFSSVTSLSRQILLNAGLLVLGVMAFYWRRQWQWSLALFGTVLLTLAASGAVNYPFKGRLILFLVPVALLAMGEGIDRLALILGTRRWFDHVLVALLVLALLWSPAQNAYDTLSPRRSAPYREDIKPVLAFMQQNWRAGDLVVLYDQAWITYEFYAPFYGLKDAEVWRLEADRNHPRQYRLAMDKLPHGRRTWFVFSSVLDVPDGTDVRTYMLDYVMESGGTILAQYNYDKVSFADLVEMED
ncbi:MAG TPA: glycosyltransferase family 39 protein, partial [Anaerolineales bacterium]